MLLSYLTLFCPALGSTEESVADQLLFYTDASATSTLDQQLRNIGLIQGILELGRSFSPKDHASTSHRPLRCIKSEQTMAVVTELEPGIWCCLCVELPKANDAQTTAIPETEMLPHPLQIQCQLHAAHDLFCASYGRLGAMIFERNHETGADRKAEVMSRLEKYWLRWAWRWKPRPAGVELIYGHKAALASHKELTSFQQQQLEQYWSSVQSDKGALLALHNGAWLWNTPRLDRAKRRLLQQVVAETSQSQEKRLSQLASSAPYQQSTDGAAGGRSWLDGKVWADSTRSVLTAFRSVSGAQATAPPEQSGADEESNGIWVYGKEVHLIWLPTDDEQQDWQQHRFLLWKQKDLTFAFIFEPEHPLPDGLLDADGLQTLYKTLSVQEEKALDQQKPTDNGASDFFSLLYDGQRGIVSSTLPDVETACLEDRQDTPQQLLVKRNTVHLHQSLYNLFADYHNGTGSEQEQKKAHKQRLIRTARNIWVVMEREGRCEVVLCKSAAAGDTAESIYRNASVQMRQMQN
ncbi:hypothetical protein BCR37DRAFT_382103 [Protomyces lactucae-debilis]|uniref:CCZ1/INTU/HSP4 first Longin domain-containing protein n=1 Tax=Protomyces lactucae-debilis TaxID=2754530 RepID=A0A1Y2F615_PROLT|nr:uncharacterized protein BCR37DRAFT_382103 [Protomyces lactucae-debilis]ORY79107.1 hypothetical protein BCR37DRAFT_382103 [Protomyces lactucae-debilis]